MIWNGGYAWLDVFLNGKELHTPSGSTQHLASRKLSPDTTKSRNRWPARFSPASAQLEYWITAAQNPGGFGILRDGALVPPPRRVPAPSPDVPLHALPRPGPQSLPVPLGEPEQHRRRLPGEQPITSPGTPRLETFGCFLLRGLRFGASTVSIVELLRNDWTGVSRLSLRILRSDLHFAVAAGREALWLIDG